MYVLVFIVYRTLTEELNTKHDELDDDKRWFVIRRSFLKEADGSDWQKPPRVEFIGEEGMDVGGLSMELFSLLFKTTEVFEGNNFSVKPKLFDEKHYRLRNQGKRRGIEKEAVYYLLDLGLTSL